VAAAIENIQWAVARILDQDFPKRPSTLKCEQCDFKKICSQQREEFSSTVMPPEIHIPRISGLDRILVRAFSDVE